MRVLGIFPEDVTRFDPKLDPDPEEPLGLEYILSAAKKDGHDIHLTLPLNITFEEYIYDIIRYAPDVLAISMFSKHVDTAKRIANAVKHILPNVIVVTGGPHPSAKPEFVSDANIDFCVIGEGEITFVELLRCIETKGDLAHIKGISFKDKNRKLLITPSRSRIGNLDSLEYPTRFRECYDYDGYGLYSPKVAELKCASVIYSRGCPYNCKFCSSPSLWKNKVYCRSICNVIEEVRYLIKEYGVNYIFFEDLTFTMDSNRIVNLCEEFIRAKLGIHWWCQTSVNNVDANLLSLMKAAGCTKIGWGIETTNDDALRKLGKPGTHHSVTSQEAFKSLSYASDLGLINLGYTMIGLPWEKEQDILQNAADLQSLNIHQLRISIATPFPGSQWHREMPESALHPDLSLYDTNHLVYDHPTISPARMKELQNEVFIRFYHSKKYRDRVVKMVKKFPRLRESFDEFLAYIDSQIELLESGQKEITQVYTLDKATGKGILA